MKEFELQGDISSGFCWRVKGATEVEEMMGGDSPESALIPVVDSTGTKRWARIQSGGKKRPPSGTAIVFDIDYGLLLASESEARRQWLAPLEMLPLAYMEKFGVENFVDPYVARELHRQELRDRESRDILNTLFGKAGDWRVALCIEARHNDYAWGKFDRALTIPNEVDRFLEAFRAIVRLKRARPSQNRQGMGALLCAWVPRLRRSAAHKRGDAPICEIEIGFEGISAWKENAARDIFTGPILGAPSGPCWQTKENKASMEKIGALFKAAVGREAA